MPNTQNINYTNYVTTTEEFEFKAPPIVKICFNPDYPLYTIKSASFYRNSSRGSEFLVIKTSTVSQDLLWQIEHSPTIYSITLIHEVRSVDSEEDKIYITDLKKGNWKIGYSYTSHSAEIEITLSLEVQ